MGVLLLACLSTWGARADSLWDPGVRQRMSDPIGIELALEREGVSERDASEESTLDGCRAARRTRDGTQEPS